MPTVRQIEAFQAVMTAGSVTRAADALGLRQPAVSRLIADLESAIGFSLFMRSGRTLSPTAKARELAREVERSFLGLHHIRATVRRLAADEQSALRLAIVPSLISDVMAEYVGPFAKAHTGAAITVEVMSTLEAAEFLEAVSCDLGITNEHAHGQGLHARVISRRTAVCVVPKGHRLARLGRPLQARDLTGERFVSFMPTSRFRRQLDRVFERARVERDLRHEARTTAAACEMAIAVGGVTVVPVAPPPEPSSRFCVLPFQPALTSDVVLLKHCHRALPPIAAMFEDFVRGQDKLRALGGSRQKRLLGVARPIVGRMPATRRRQSGVVRSQ